ncbi:hypothetical protein C8J56DRAFT_903369 [Mycena floridula]|nr:hypothetical protein C8J56DRAFT_903369 [Mycena floridula]
MEVKKVGFADQIVPFSQYFPFLILESAAPYAGYELSSRRKMRTRTHLASAVFVNLATLLPRKLVLIGTIIALLLATFFSRYSSCSASLKVFNDLVVDAESAARESLGILETDFIVEANHSLARQKENQSFDEGSKGMWSVRQVPRDLGTPTFGLILGIRSALLIMIR